uniref:Acidic ribosomal protein P1B n=1 Tax=Euplotoides octocarinatus TaxID=2716877 RepID=A0A0N9EKJ5_EUPOC|nr:acidic ribosomal protein P1B [Euplotes octocarinatus]
MASTAVVSKSEHDELCCSYSALILQDNGSDVTADSLSKLIAASGNQVESYWPGLFAKAVSGVDIKALLSNLGGSGGGAAAPAAGGATKADAPVEEEKEPQEEEADVGVGDIFAQADEY